MRKNQLRAALCRAQRPDRGWTDGAFSSNEGDAVLDPFCGCGTAVHAAQKLNRQWIGIDITHLAISLIEKRLNDEIHGDKL